MSKVDPFSRYRAVRGPRDVKAVRLERGAFLEYWPIGALPTVPLSTTMARELVATKVGSAGRIRTHNLLVNSLPSN